MHHARSVKRFLQDAWTGATAVLAATGGGAAMPRSFAAGKTLHVAAPPPPLPTPRPRQLGDVAASASRPVSLNPLFGSGMVLNAERARLYGTAPVGRSVEVSLPTLNVSGITVTAPSGRWLVDLGNLTPTGPLDVYISAGENITLSDVHVGQVFVFTGASNVRHPLYDIAYGRRWGEYEPGWRAKAQDEILRGPHPLVRIFEADKEPNHVRREVHANFRDWRVATPQSPEVGALPYLFARRLQPQIGVAVGIVQVAAGGSITEHWMPESAPVGLRLHRHDSSLYYNMLSAPLIDYGYTALVIYQGESEPSHTANLSRYEEQLVHWIQSSRDDARYQDLPVMVVGTSGMRPKQDTPTEFPEGLHCYDVFAVREAQISAVKCTSYSAYVVTSDIGDTRYVHAPNKWDIAERLVKAHRKLVQHADYPTLSPTLASWQVQGSNFILSFDGLTEPVAPGHQVGCAGPVRPLPYSHISGLAITNASYEWVWANASFSEKKLHVFSDAIAEPVAVRYAWARNPIGNLYTFPHGQPVAPFRTDTLPMVLPDVPDHACSKGPERGEKPFNPTAGDLCPAL